MAVPGRLRSATRRLWGILHAHTVEGTGTYLREVCREHGILALGALLQDLQDEIVRGSGGLCYLERGCCNHCCVDKDPVRRVGSLLRWHTADAAQNAAIAKRREGDSPSLVGLLELGHGIEPTQGQGCRLGDANFA